MKIDTSNSAGSYGLDPSQLMRARAMRGGLVKRGAGAPASTINITPEARRAEPSGGPSFADLLKRVVASDNEAQSAVDAYASGQKQSVHETMLKLQKADINFSLLVNVRNKLLDAYREVMRLS